MKHRFALSIVVVLGTLSRAAAAQAPFGGPEDHEPSSTPPPAAEATLPDEASASRIAPQAKKPPTPVQLRLDGGYSPRRLVSLPVVGADMGLALGAQPSKYAAVWGTSRLFLGSTENGLDVFSARIGMEAEGVILERLRLGLGLQGFLVGIDRAARDQTILSWGPAIAATARVDLFQSDGYAIFARAASDGGVEVYEGTAFWGATFGGGVDFDIVGERAALK